MASPNLLKQYEYTSTRRGFPVRFLTMESAQFFPRGEGSVMPQIRVVQEEFLKLWQTNTHGFQIHFRTWCEESLNRREGDILTEEDCDYRNMLVRVIEHDVVIWRLYLGYINRVRPGTIALGLSLLACEAKLEAQMADMFIKKDNQKTTSLTSLLSAGDTLPPLSCPLTGTPDQTAEDKRFMEDLIDPTSELVSVVQAFEDSFWLHTQKLWYFADLQSIHKVAKIARALKANNRKGHKKKDAIVPVFSSKQMLDMSASHQHVIDAFNRATQSWSWYIGVCQANETDADRKAALGSVKDAIDQDAKPKDRTKRRPQTGQERAQEIRLSTQAQPGALF